MNKILAQDDLDALLRGLSGGEIESETQVDEDTSEIGRASCRERV